MRGSPEFSIVTVVLNDREGFEKTARSIIEQQGVDVEWIVIDGGSTDGTTELIKSYSEEGWVASWTSEPDRGIFDAMNKGLAAAHGEFLLFLNADDRLYQKRILEQVAMKARTVSEACSMIFGNVLYEYPTGYGFLQEYRIIDDCIWHRTPTSHQATFFRTRFHQKYPYDLSYPVCSDYYGVCAVYQESSMCAYVDVIVAITPHGSDSSSHGHPWVAARETMRIQREILRLRWPKVILSFVRREISFVAEWMLSSKVLAPLAWVVVRRVRPPAPS